MKVRRIDSRQGFEALAPLWTDLAREGGHSSPFLSHDWFACCWEAGAPSRRAEALVVEDAAGPVAVVPLARRRGALHRAPVRVLGMLTAPDTAFTDWLITGRPEPVVEAVLDELDRWKDWDVLDLNALPVDSPTVKALETTLPGRFRWQRGATVRSPHVTITGTWDTYWTAKSQRFKKTIRSVRNRLVKAGTVSIEEYRQVSVDSPVFAELLDVSRRSWKAGEGVAIATMPGMPAFFSALTDRASRRGWLRVWILRLEGRAIATEYQLEADGRVHALRADFDASLPEELSPGSHLSYEILRTLFGREGVHEYDMGPGENPYKARWASGARETIQLRMFRRGLYGSMLHGLETRAVPALRRLLDRRAR
jgi:CelD/BcsL family acetyltransferase involved in cellulose biosynthesis